MEHRGPRGQAVAQEARRVGTRMHAPRGAMLLRYQYTFITCTQALTDCSLPSFISFSTSLVPASISRIFPLPAKMHFSVLLASLGLGCAGLVWSDSVFPPKPDDPTTPLGLRLSLHGHQTMAVAWSTYESIAEACLHYGTNKHHLTRKVCGDSHSIPDVRQIQHQVHIKGLEPDKLYWYKILSSNSTVWPMKAGKKVGHDGPFIFAIATDLGLYGKYGFGTLTSSCIVEGVLLSTVWRCGRLTMQVSTEYGVGLNVKLQVLGPSTFSLSYITLVVTMTTALTFTMCSNSHWSRL